MNYTVRSLDSGTWAAFAKRRDLKRVRVFSGRAHAALVFDVDGLVQGWCQYGSPAELPRIKHRREYDRERRAPARFLFSGTAELFDQYGFRRIRRVGKHAWIVATTVHPA